MRLRDNVRRSSNLFTISIVLINRTTNNTAARVLVARASFRFVRCTFTWHPIEGTRFASNWDVGRATWGHRSEGRSYFPLFKGAQWARQYRVAIAWGFFCRFFRAFQNGCPIFLTRFRWRFVNNFCNAKDTRYRIPTLGARLPNWDFRFLYYHRADTLGVLFVSSPTERMGLNGTSAARPTTFGRGQFRVFAGRRFHESTTGVGGRFTAFLQLNVFRTRGGRANFFVAKGGFGQMKGSLFHTFRGIDNIRHLARHVNTSCASTNEEGPL